MTVYIYENSDEGLTVEIETAQDSDGNRDSIVFEDTVPQAYSGLDALRVIEFLNKHLRNKFHIIDNRKK